MRACHDTPSRLYPFIESYLERDELLLRELLLLGALLCDEVLRLLDTLLRLVPLLLLRETLLLLLALLLLRDTLLLLLALLLPRDTLLLLLAPLLLLLRDTLLLDELLRELDAEDALLRDELGEWVREVLTLVVLSRRVVVVLLRPVVAVERLFIELLLLSARLDPVRLGVFDVTAVRRFSSELSFTIRLFLSREGTLTYPFLRSRRLFS